MRERRGRALDRSCDRASRARGAGRDGARACAARASFQARCRSARRASVCSAPRSTTPRAVGTTAQRAPRLGCDPSEAPAAQAARPPRGRAAVFRRDTRRCSTTRGRATAPRRARRRWAPRRTRSPRAGGSAGRWRAGARARSRPSHRDRAPPSPSTVSADRSRRPLRRSRRHVSPIHASAETSPALRRAFTHAIGSSRRASGHSSTAYSTVQVMRLRARAWSQASNRRAQRGTSSGSVALLEPVLVVRPIVELALDVERVARAVSHTVEVVRALPDPARVDAIAPLEDVGADAIAPTGS